MIRKIDDARLSAIADAIRQKNGQTDSYTVAQMPAAIEAIEGGTSLNDIEAAVVDFVRDRADIELIDGVISQNAHVIIS